MKPNEPVVFVREDGGLIDLTKPETMADEKCEDCHGRGVQSVIIEKNDPAPRLCGCVLSFLKKPGNGHLAFAFLRVHGQVK